MCFVIFCVILYASFGFVFVRDLLSMSLESSRLSLSGNMNTSHSNAASVAGSSSRVPPSAGSCSRSQRQGPASHNVWRKLSAGEESC